MRSDRNSLRSSPALIFVARAQTTSAWAFAAPCRRKPSQVTTWRRRGGMNRSARFTYRQSNLAKSMACSGPGAQDVTSLRLATSRMACSCRLHRSGVPYPSRTAAPLRRILGAGRPLSTWSPAGDRRCRRNGPPPARPRRRQGCRGCQGQAVQERPACYPSVTQAGVLGNNGFREKGLSL